MTIRNYLRIGLWASALPIVAVVAAQGPGQKPDPLAEPFKGVTANGTITPGLFPIRSTGVSTAPVRTAAVAFLASAGAGYITGTQLHVNGGMFMD